MDNTKAIEFMQSQNFPFFSHSLGCLWWQNTLFLLVSLDRKEDRVNGYIENSKYCRISIDFDDWNGSYYNYWAEPKITIDAFTNTTGKKINKKTIKDIANSETLILKQLAKIVEILHS